MHDGRSLENDGATFEYDAMIPGYDSLVKGQAIIPYSRTLVRNRVTRSLELLKTNVIGYIKTYTRKLHHTIHFEKTEKTLSLSYIPKQCFTGRTYICEYANYVH